ncbi:hypothetical protein EDD15DRAFT_1699407 [Pisolithus albus]|nr:hypothetical protein EDD15DRAFT_1699407 [Pisolithus albus]
MAEDGPSLDGLGLGGLSSTRDTESKPSIFGNSATPTSFQQPSSGGGNEGLIKSGVGFGAALDQNSPFAKPSSFAPSGPSFGQSTFGQTTTSPFTPSKPAFGQTSFQQPAFGQSGFGQPAFGQPAFGQAGLGQSQTTGSGGLAFGKPSFGSLPTTSRPPDAPATSTSGGAFEAFATDGATGFAAFANKVSKPVWAASEDQKNAPEKSRAVFGPSTTSALAPAPEPALAKAEPVRITGEQTKPAAAALPSSLFAARESPLPQTESRSPSPVGSRLSPSPPTTSPKAATRESPLPQTESRSPSPVGGRLSPSPPTTSPKAATRESPLPQTESRSPSPVGGRLSPSPPTTSPKAATRESPLPQTESRSPSPVGGRLSPSPPTTSPKAATRESPLPQTESRSPSPVGGRPSPSPPTTSPKAATPIASFGSGDPLKGTTTTPPGSPVKEAAFPAPASKPPLPAGSPFNLPPRIGTNNRPIRSSPLASTPLVGELDSLASPTPPPPSKSAPPVVTAPGRSMENVGQERGYRTAAT